MASIEIIEQHGWYYVEYRGDNVPYRYVSAPGRTPIEAQINLMTLMDNLSRRMFKIKPDQIIVGS